MKMKTLQQIATEIAQEYVLSMGFDPFGNELQPQVVGQSNGRSTNTCIVWVGFEVAHEGPIEFQSIDRQQFQIGQR